MNLEQVTISDCAGALASEAKNREGVQFFRIPKRQIIIGWCSGWTGIQWDNCYIGGKTFDSPEDAANHILDYEKSHDIAVN